MAGVLEGKVWEVRYYASGVVTPSTPTPQNVEKRVYVAAEDIPQAYEKVMNSSHNGNMFKGVFAINIYQNGIIF